MVADCVVMKARFHRISPAQVRATSSWFSRGRGPLGCDESPGELRRTGVPSSAGLDAAVWSRFHAVATAALGPVQLDVGGFKEVFGVAVVGWNHGGDADADGDDVFGVQRVWFGEVHYGGV